MRSGNLFQLQLTKDGDSSAGNYNECALRRTLTAKNILCTEFLKFDRFKVVLGHSRVLFLK